MKKLFVLLAIFVLAAPAAVLAGAKIDSNAEADSTTAERDYNAKVDSTAEVDSNVKIDFNVKCAKCHRATKLLLKTAKLLEVDPGKLALRASKMNREEMIAIIEKGKDKMPGFEKELTKGQITGIVDYIIFMKKRSNIRSGSPTRLY